MSKKEEILQLFSEGKSAIEIENLGYSKSYINKVFKEVKEVEEVEEVEPVSHEESSFSINSFDSLEKLIRDLKEILKDGEGFELNFNIRVKKITSGEKSINKGKARVKKATSIINPIELYRDLGRDSLQEVLTALSIDELKAISKKYAPDPRGYVNRWKSKTKIIEYLMERTISLADNGSVFYT